MQIFAIYTPKSANFYNFSPIIAILDNFPVLKVKNMGKFFHNCFAGWGKNILLWQNIHLCVDLVSIRQYQLSIQRPAYLQKSILYYHAVDIRIRAVRFCFFLVEPRSEMMCHDFSVPYKSLTILISEVAINLSANS